MTDALLLIGGERVDGLGTPLEVDPFTQQPLASVGTASAEQVLAAVATAREAAPGWAGTPAVERADLLHEVANRLRAQAGSSRGR